MFHLIVRFKKKNDSKSNNIAKVSHTHQIADFISFALCLSKRCVALIVQYRLCTACRHSLIYIYIHYICSECDVMLWLGVCVCRNICVERRMLVALRCSKHHLRVIVVVDQDQVQWYTNEPFSTRRSHPIPVAPSHIAIYIHI